MGQYHDMTPVQHQSTLQRIVDLCGRFHTRGAVGCTATGTVHDGDTIASCSSPHVRASASLFVLGRYTIL